MLLLRTSLECRLILSNGAQYGTIPESLADMIQTGCRGFCHRATDPGAAGAQPHGKKRRRAGLEGGPQWAEGAGGTEPSLRADDCGRTAHARQALWDCRSPEKLNPDEGERMKNQVLMGKIIGMAQSTFPTVGTRIIRVTALTAGASHHRRRRRKSGRTEHGKEEHRSCSSPRWRN